MKKHVMECSCCNMSQHIGDRVCEFCGSHLRTDKLRHALRCNIPYLSLVILVLLVVEMALPLSHVQEQIVLIFDEFILLVFLVDIGLDKCLHRGQFRDFLRRRSVDILFVLPLLKTLKMFEAVPMIGRALKGLHAVQHVGHIESRMFFDMAKAGHIAKYAKYAYPAVARR